MDIESYHLKDQVKEWDSPVKRYRGAPHAEY